MGNSELIRIKANALRRRYQRCNITELKQLYKRKCYDFKETYKEKINLAKITSWRNFCYKNTESSLFGVSYKIAFNKVKIPLFIAPITKTDETSITLLLEPINYMQDNNF